MSYQAPEKNRLERTRCPLKATCACVTPMFKGHLKYLVGHGMKTLSLEEHMVRYMLKGTSGLCLACLILVHWLQ